MSLRAHVLEVGFSWVKTPYHHEQGVKGHGVDCAHYLKEVFAEAGIIQQVDVTGYPPDWYLHRSEERFLAWVERYAIPSPYFPPQPADIVMVKVGRCFSHGAIVTNWPLALHAVRLDGMVLESDITAGQFEGRPLLHYTFEGYDK